MHIDIRLMTVVVGLLANIFLFPEPSLAQKRGYVIKEFHKTYPLEKNWRIRLENVNGDVRITGWEKAEVKLDAVISGRSEERINEIEIDVDSYGNRLYIETRYPKWDRDNWPKGESLASVDYTLSIPRTALLDEVTVVNGAIDITKLEGEIRASSVNGDIRADGLRGEGNLTTVNGDMDLVCFQADHSTPIEMTSVNGRIRLTLPSDANVRINASSVHGQIRTDFGVAVQKGSFAGRKFAARLGEGEGRIDLSNVNGTITIRRASDGNP
ncbi:MAG: DUF4097 family beta strand repeat protein [candidate division Zixibacteria bacterium]|nr:DUF4097 family beta strand repeat protein [candidate division Zixibacteria bacterium]